MTDDLLELAARVADLECKRAGSFAWRRGRKAVLSHEQYMATFDAKQKAYGFCWGPDAEISAALGDARRQHSLAVNRALREAMAAA